MDILIRDIDPEYVKELEKKAKEITKRTGQKMSRNEYIKMLIQHDSELKLIQYKQDKFDEALRNITSNLSMSLQSQEVMLQKFIDSNNRLFYLMATGGEVEEENL